MDAQQALADLTEISSQIRAAVIFDDGGKVAGSTLDDARAEALARSAAELLSVADGVKNDGSELTQLEAATEEGSVFVVRQGPTRIAATTGTEPTVGLVFYDLKSALRNLEAKEEPPKPKRPPRKKPAATAEKKPAAAPKKPPPARKPAPRKKKADGDAA